MNNVRDLEQRNVYPMFEKETHSYVRKREAGSYLDSDYCADEARLYFDEKMSALTLGWFEKSGGILNWWLGLCKKNRTPFGVRPVNLLFKTII